MFTDRDLLLKIRDNCFSYLSDMFAGQVEKERDRYRILIPEGMVEKNGRWWLTTQDGHIKHGEDEISLYMFKMGINSKLEAQRKLAAKYFTDSLPVISESVEGCLPYLNEFGLHEAITYFVKEGEHLINLYYEYTTMSWVKVAAPNIYRMWGTDRERVGKKLVLFLDEWDLFSLSEEARTHHEYFFSSWMAAPSCPNKVPLDKYVGQKIFIWPRAGDMDEAKKVGDLLFAAGVLPYIVDTTEPPPPKGPEKLLKKAVEVIPPDRDDTLPYTEETFATSSMSEHFYVERTVKAPKGEKKSELYDRVGLLANSRGNLISSPTNIHRAIKWMEREKILNIKHDYFSAKDIYSLNGGDSLKMEGVHYKAVWMWMDEYFYMNGKVSDRTIANVLQTHAEMNCFFDRATIWFEKLPPWDGKERMENFAANYLSAADNELSKFISKALFMSITNRAMLKRGQTYKYDEMIVLEGPQGQQKSMALEALLPREFYVEPTADIGSKDFLGNCSGKLLVELSELSSLGRSSAETIKRVCSTQVDRFRRPYGTSDIERPRRFVMVGTTNSESYLTDETGARRFLPLKIQGRARPRAIEQDRLQLWAEAYACYLQAPGKTCSIVPANLRPMLKQLQRSRSGSIYELEKEQIFLLLRGQVGGGNVKDGICRMTNKELYHGIYPDKDTSDRRVATRLGCAARYSGGEPCQIRRHGVQYRGWEFDLDRLGLLDNTPQEVEPAPREKRGQISYLEENQ